MRRRPSCSFMSTNVGLLTTLRTPRPAATPFARCVFPAPSSPTRASTVPGMARLPSARPMSCVACGPLLSSAPRAGAGAVDRSIRGSIGTSGSALRPALRGLEVGERHRRRPTVVEADDAGPGGNSGVTGVETVEDPYELAGRAGERPAVGDHPTAGSRPDPAPWRRLGVVHVQPRIRPEQAGQVPVVLAEPCEQLVVEADLAVALDNDHGEVVIDAADLAATRLHGLEVAQLLVQ